MQSIKLQDIQYWNDQLVLIECSEPEMIKICSSEIKQVCKNSLLKAEKWAESFNSELKNHPGELN